MTQIDFSEFIRQQKDLTPKQKGFVEDVLTYFEDDINPHNDCFYFDDKHIIYTEEETNKFLQSKAVKKYIDVVNGYFITTGKTDTFIKKFFKENLEALKNYKLVFGWVKEV